MKFRVEREVLAEALGAAARVASTRNNAMPALSGVRIEVTGDKLLLSCTDNDLSVQFVLNVGGLEDGIVVASAKLMSDIVRSMSEGKVTVETTGETADSAPSGRRGPGQRGGEWIRHSPGQHHAGQSGQL